MRIFPPPVAKKRARANSFPRDRPRTLVGGRAAVDLRRKQNLKRNDRKTLSPSPFPLARFGRNDDSARLGPQLRPLVRNRYPRSFARFIARRGSHRTRRAKKRRLSVEQDVISAEYPIGEMQIAFRRCYSQPCILSVCTHISTRYAICTGSEVLFILVNRGYGYNGGETEEADFGLRSLSA